MSQVLGDDFKLWEEKNVPLLNNPARTQRDNTIEDEIAPLIENILCT